MLTIGRIARRADIEDWMFPFTAYRYGRWNDFFAAYTAADTVIDFLLWCTL